MAMEGRRPWESTCHSFVEGLQKGLDRLVKKKEGISWPFENVGAYEASPISSLLSLQQQEEEREKTTRASRKDSFLLGAGFLVLQERNSASTASFMEFNRSTLKMHGAQRTECMALVSPLRSQASEPLSGGSIGGESPSSTEPSAYGHKEKACPDAPFVSQRNEHPGWIEKVALASFQAKAMMRDISVLERAQIGAGAGGIAGAITYACLHPLDTVKTKLQTRGASDLYSGPLDVIAKTFQNQGILGFYSGISAVLVGSMFSSAVYFGTCELGKALLVQVPNLPAIAIPPIAGAMGNLVSSAILVPKELITQRMQVGAQGRSWEVFVRTIEKEGFRGLYTGYSAALVRNLPASVLSFSSFEYLKTAWMKKTGKNRLEPWQSVFSGAVAGAISSALTTPLDVVKTRLMTQARTEVLKTTDVSRSVMAEAELKAKIAASTYKGITSTLRKIWLEEGWRGLTKGVLPRILYSACFSALGYFAFETARLALVKRHLVKKKQLVLHPV